MILHVNTGRLAPLRSDQKIFFSERARCYGPLPVLAPARSGSHRARQV